MRFLSLALSLALLPTLLWAKIQMTAGIHHLDHGDQMGEETLVYLSNGRVVRMKNFDLSLIEEMQEGVQSKKVFELELSDHNEILNLNVSAVQPQRLSAPSPSQKSLMTETFIPSILGLEKANELFRESIPSPKESQCFNRAHVWSHEWRIKHKVYSNKMWMFFTRKYIRDFAFGWWFHVAPMIHMVEEGKVRERVMDVKYARGPLKIKQWTDIFMRNDAPCPLVENYSDHSNFPEWGSCFTMKSSMYYYQPVDLEWKEAFSMDRSSYLPSEIIAAYLEAFEIDLEGK